MTSECNEFLDRIPKSFVADLSPQDQESLNRHLEACSPCREEHKRYEETLGMLQSAVDEPVPRHFFVYPQESAAKPWRLFRQLPARWQVAALGMAAVAIMMIAAPVSGLQIRSDGTSWSVSFGRTNDQPGIDIAALKAEILKAADERNHDAAMGWIQNLRAEIGSRSNISQEQQTQTLAALTSLEIRLNNRILNTAEEIRSGTAQANLDLFRGVSLQREEDINRVNTRLDGVVEANQDKARQTDEILETLLQIISNLQLPGEQK